MPSYEANNSGMWRIKLRATVMYRRVLICDVYLITLPVVSIAQRQMMG
jgi:hypothetical protein